MSLKTTKTSRAGVGNCGLNKTLRSSILAGTFLAHTHTYTRTRIMSQNNNNTAATGKKLKVMLDDDIVDAIIGSIPEHTELGGAVWANKTNSYLHAMPEDVQNIIRDILAEMYRQYRDKYREFHREWFCFALSQISRMGAAVEWGALPESEVYRRGIERARLERTKATNAYHFYREIRFGLSAHAWRRHQPVGDERTESSISWDRLTVEIANKCEADRLTASNEYTPVASDYAAAACRIYENYEDGNNIMQFDDWDWDAPDDGLVFDETLGE